jgi:hypothetical protein
MTPFVRYIGPYDEVDVPDARLIVKRNQTIEVSRELADGMLQQTENWAKAPQTKVARKRREAAEVELAPEAEATTTIEPGSEPTAGKED